MNHSLYSFVSRLFVFAFLCFGAPAYAAGGFDAYLNEMQEEARAQGIAPEYRALIGGLRLNEKVRELAAFQPEYVKPIWAYLDIMITDNRVSLGRAALARHDDFLRALTREYGVPRSILVAIWGVETNYGSNKGSFSVLQALATLGYEGRRARFGRQQLLAALAILQDGDVAPEQMLGSWAGAMGHTQFIPTTYRAYAVDATGDGKRDIWNNIEDALGSTANYLRVSGWQRDLVWGFEVSLPQDFDYARADIFSPRPASFWRARGVKGFAHEITDALGDVSIFVPSGARGPAYLVTKNFRALLRYNTAPAYALAVSQLSERFTRTPKQYKDWARSDRPLLPREIKQLQSALQKLGYDVGDADGVMGSRTRKAVRAYQKRAGLAADAYATPALLQNILQDRGGE